MILLLVVGLTLGVPAAQSQRPNVILITMDTTRADRMGFLGSKRGLTPNLDAVAKEGVVFTRAYAQAPITTVSHATIFTGTYPQFHKVNDFGKRIPVSLPVISEIFKKQGYKTAAFVGSIILDPRGAMAPGFDRGFDTYAAGYRRRMPGDDRYKTMERRADEVVARALAWLAKNAASGPFFLWVHIWDPHEPYQPPAAYARKFPGVPYDAEVAYSDAMLGRLFADLRARQLYDNTAIVVTADHGESLGAHGENSHGIFLYDETIHVPLLMKLPAGKSAGLRVKTRVGSVDLAPSMLDMAGIQPPAHMQGQTLVRTLARANQPDRPSYAETDYPRRAFGWSSVAAWRSANYLYIRAPKPEVYDLATDPQGKKNLADSSKSLLDRLASQAEEFRKRSAGTGPDTPDQPLDPKLAQQLSALGYASAGGKAAPTGKEGIDPKDKIGVANLLHDAQLAVEEGKTAAVVPLLEKVVATDPQIFTAQLQLGLAYARQRNHAKAIPALRAATEIQPDTAMAHYELGLVLFRSGELKTSAAHFEIAANLMPKWADTHFSLASVWARDQRVPEAIEKLKLTLTLDEEHYQANLLLGRIHHLQGRSAEALPFLELAAQSPEASSEAQVFLAEAYERLGRSDDALRARARAAQMRRPGAAQSPSTP